MRKVNIDVYCDPCHADGIEALGEELPPIAIGNGNVKGRVAAMCKEHRVALYEPLAALLPECPTIDALESGKAVKRPRVQQSGGTPSGDRPPPSQMPGSSTGKAIKCPLDECDETRVSPSGISDHLRKNHSTTLYDTIGPEGTLYDVDGDAVDTPRPRRKSA